MFLEKENDPLKQYILEIESLKNLNRLKEAQKLTEKYIIKYNEDYRLYEELADISIYLSEINKAQKAIDYALILNPESATGNYLKGFILLSKDKFKESLTFLEKSNKLMGNNAEVLRNLGWAYSMNQDFERGIMILKRALSIAPGDNLITEDLAMALIGAGEVSEGYELLSKVKKNKNAKKV